MFRLKKNLILSIAIKLTSILLAVPAFAVISKNLPAVAAANWFTILSVVPIFLLLTSSIGNSLTNVFSQSKPAASKLIEFKIAVLTVRTISVRLAMFLVAISIFVSEILAPEFKDLYWGVGVVGVLFVLVSPIQLIDSICIANGKTYKVQLNDLSTTFIFFIFSYFSISMGLGLYTLCIIFPASYFFVRLTSYYFDKDTSFYIKVLLESYRKAERRGLYFSRESKNFLYIGIFNVIGTSLDLFFINHFMQDTTAVVALAFFNRLFLVYSLIGASAAIFWPYLNFHISNGNFKHSIKMTFLLEGMFLIFATLISFVIWINGEIIKNIFLPNNITIPASLFFLALVTRSLTLLGEGVTPIMQTQQLVNLLTKITVAMSVLSIIVKPFALIEYGLVGLLISNLIIFGVFYLAVGLLSLRAAYIEQYKI